MEVIEIIKNAYTGYADYLWKQVTLQNDGGLWGNYFWMLVIISAIFFGLELMKPWRKDQPKFRKDFWLDFFYMFFNFFLFNLIIFGAGSDVLVNFFNTWVLNLTGLDLKTVNPVYAWPLWGVLLFGFVLRDFVQWWTHRLLHRVPFLWNFHKVHHSVEQMGFAAHLRYHWMETIVYRSIEYVPLALAGVNLYEFFLIHIFTLAWGHYNHANITVDKRITAGILGGLIALFLLTTSYPVGFLAGAGIVIGSVTLSAFLLGPIMKYLFNSPEMHIWHHSYELPEDRPHGINFGLTLAIWDYIFGTARIPKDGRDIRLGFPGIRKFPNSFWKQVTYGFGKSKEEG
ncbi:MAG: sterol desaturase family protein [Flavobacteriales bacterium]|nr:sterol desaturase family protein [Flavobacteriales bacterium]